MSVGPFGFCPGPSWVSFSPGPVFREPTSRWEILEPNKKTKTVSPPCRWRSGILTRHCGLVLCSWRPRGTNATPNPPTPGTTTCSRWRPPTLTSSATTTQTSWTASRWGRTRPSTQRVSRFHVPVIWSSRCHFVAQVLDGRIHEQVKDYLVSLCQTELEGYQSVHDTFSQVLGRSGMVSLQTQAKFGSVFHKMKVMVHKFGLIAIAICRIFFHWILWSRNSCKIGSR